jgi:hypothetical protein
VLHGAGEGALIGRDVGRKSTLRICFWRFAFAKFHAWICAGGVTGAGPRRGGSVRPHRGLERGGDFPLLIIREENGRSHCGNSRKVSSRGGTPCGNGGKCYRKGCKARGSV